LIFCIKKQKACPVGAPDKRRGGMVKAFAVLKPCRTAMEDDLIEFGKAEPAAYRVSELAEFSEALPKAAIGKILHKAMHERNRRPPEWTKDS